MSLVLVALGVLLLAYGVLMGVLYPANGFFLVWLVAGALCCWVGWAQRSGIWAEFPVALRRGVAAAGLVAMIGIGSGCALIWRDAAATPPASLDCLVVLGASLNADGSPKETLRYRLDAAAAYLAENPETRCVLSGGRGPDEPQTEASAMATYLRVKGVATDRILLEDRSKTTAENLRFSRVVVEREMADGSDASVGVVTNDFHVFRAVRLARGQGFSHVWGVSTPTNPLYLPHALVRECFAVGKDALTGALH